MILSIKKWLIDRTGFIYPLWGAAVIFGFLGFIDYKNQCQIFNICLLRPLSFIQTSADLILFWTFLTIVIYSIETYRLRDETYLLREEARSTNKRSVKPMLVLRFLDITHRDTYDVSIYLKNIGSGTAVNIRWRIKIDDQIADRSWFHRSLNQGILPRLWPDSGFRLTMFRKHEYLERDLWKYLLYVEYDWGFGKNEIEIFPLDLDYYISSNMPKEWLSMIEAAWLKESIEKIVERSQLEWKNMEENQYIVEFPNGYSRAFPTENAAREFMDGADDLIKEHGEPQLRMINPNDSDVGKGDGRL